MAGTGLKTFMLIAGETSGDLLASELVLALRAQWPDAKFFGAGGPKMAAAGVELAVDMTQHAVVGISDVLKNYFKFCALFHQLLALAVQRKPDAVIGVDYGGFNLRFGHAVRNYVRHNPQANWHPKIVQFVSPQVWASRPGRANRLAADYDLLLSIFPFEKKWYAERVPKLRVEFVGHPMLDRIDHALRSSGRESALTNSSHVTRHSSLPSSHREPTDGNSPSPGGEGRGEGELNSNSKLKTQNSKLNSPVTHHSPLLLLLPGSRKSELERHLPVMLGAFRRIREKLPSATAKIVLPNETLKLLAQSLHCDVEIQVGNLPDALTQADVAIASTGTVTMECAFFGVPAVTLYKTSWLTYEIGRHVVTVTSLTMPNLMAGEEVYPEFIQDAATPGSIARAALGLLQNESRRQKIKSQLAQIVSSLGEPGATRRAATAVSSLFQ